ncbi:ATP-dependent helicase [Pseudonocardia zijingensis]|uniref:DNA 3'-5' helicase n=1 Tax=Pseudonocardia zijingensis TaxID=153376 RepID=A0ABP3YPD0_9PSEU
MTPLDDSLKALKKNPGQWRAFQQQGHCVVVAPPGSGKTKLLTTRFVVDMLTKVDPPHGAACVTLTNAAADEIRERVAVLGVPGRANVFIGTVHSFTLNSILRPFANVADLSHVLDRRIAGKAEQEQAFKYAMTQEFFTRRESYTVRSTIETYRRRFVSDEMWARVPKIRRVADAYLRYLKQHNLVDFDEIIATAVHLAETVPAVRRVIGAKYRRLYVDEYQDLAPALDRLVRALCFDNQSSTTLFAVGDPDQSIYGWTGSRPELLDELTRKPGVATVPLEENYRSGAGILQVAELLRKRAGRRPMSTSRSGGVVTATLCRGGLLDQCNVAAAQIASWHSSGTPLHEVGVIAPTNAHCREVEQAFRRHNIPILVRGESYRLTQSTSLIEDAAAWALLGREASGHRLGLLLRRWRGCLGSRWTREADVKFLAQLFDFEGRADDPAHLFISGLLDLGLREADTSTTASEDHDEILRMERAYKGGELAQASSAVLAERGRRLNRIEGLTMSSCKGLEFEKVCILGLDQKQVPHFNSLDDEQKLAEDRRKVYVAVTRARSSVSIFYSGFVQWSRSIDHAGPSQFLREMRLI